MTANTAPSRLNAAEAIPASNHIGEAPLWDSAHARLVWVDHAEGEVRWAEPRGSQWLQTAKIVLGGHVAAALPRKAGGVVVVGAANLTKLDETGASAPYWPAPFASGSMRFNEAKTDARGRIWAGAMAADLSATGAVYCLDGDGQWRAVVTGARLPNGMDWSPDGSRFYFINSMTQTLDQFECDSEGAALGWRRTLIDFTDQRGSPNGMCVDSEGTLWVALTGAGEVRGYWPDGALKVRIQAPTRCVTSCAFGGADGRTLFITSRSGRLPDFASGFGLSDDELVCAGEGAGALFACRPGAAGPPAHAVVDHSALKQ